MEMSITWKGLYWRFRDRLPYSLADNIPTKHQRYKEGVCLGKMEPHTYKQLVSKYMVGKKVAIRSINSTKIDGSLKMVISIGTSGQEGTIEIPETIASKTKVPCVKNGTVSFEYLTEGDYGLLVRQPCLWSGGIQPVKVRITPSNVISSGLVSASVYLIPIDCPLLVVATFDNCTKIHLVWFASSVSE